MGRGSLLAWPCPFEPCTSCVHPSITNGPTIPLLFVYTKIQISVTYLTAESPPHIMGRRSGGYVFSCGATTHKVPRFSVTDRHRKHIVPQCLGNVCVGTLIATSVISPLSLPSSWAFGKVLGWYWLGMEVYLKWTGVHLLWQWEVMICNWGA